jgi:hypothetical protein
VTVFSILQQNNRQKMMALKSQKARKSLSNISLSSPGDLIQITNEFYLVEQFGKTKIKLVE